MVTVPTCTGQCCKAFHIDKIAHADLNARNLGNFKDGHTLLQMLLPVGRDEAASRLNQNLTGKGENWYTCRWFDDRTNRCLNYENRPDMCSDYPYKEGTCHYCGGGYESELPCGNES